MGEDPSGMGGRGTPNNFNEKTGMGSSHQCSKSFTPAHQNLLSRRRPLSI